jgi:HD-GYP domain-containing protein (c-di-GMP phosphodiesterase class II)
MIVTECRSFCNADAGSLFTLEDNKLIFRVAQTESLEKRMGYKPSFKAFPLPLNNMSVAGYVALTGETIIVEDCASLNDPNKPPLFDTSYDKKMGYRSKSMLAIPMRDNKEEIIGVLELINAMKETDEVVSFPDLDIVKHIENNSIPFTGDIAEMMQSISSQAAVAIRNARLITEIKNLFAAFVKYSATAIDERSPHTAGHNRRVAGMSMRIANAINLVNEGALADIKFTDQELEELWFSAWLHDIGKIAVKEAVLEKDSKIPKGNLNSIVIRLLSALREKQVELVKKCKETDDEECKKLKSDLKSDIRFLAKLNKANFFSDADEARLKEIATRHYSDFRDKKKPLFNDYEMKNLTIKRGNLTPEEWVEMRSHVVRTRNIVRKIPFTKGLANVANIAACHHEMIDGSGYPDRIKGDEIPFPAKILAVADIFDALRAPDRPYKKQMTLEKTFSILREEAQKGRLDSRLVELVIEKQLFEGHNDDQAEYPWKIEVF